MPMALSRGAVRTNVRPQPLDSLVLQKCEHAHIARIKAQIVTGTFCFADEFPGIGACINSHGVSSRDRAAKYSTTFFVTSKRA